MALKNKVSEVKHLLVSGVPEELNVLVGDYLNNGWEPLEAKLVTFDAQNRLLTILWVFAKYTKSE